MLPYTCPGVVICLLRKGVEPQSYADRLPCMSGGPDLLLSAARFTTGHVRLVGHKPAPSKCVLLSTSMVVRKSGRIWVTGFCPKRVTNGLSSMMSVILGVIWILPFVDGLLP